jgi:anti-sigma regulatory factor (Ser/Thr protein kinase)
MTSQHPYHGRRWTVLLRESRPGGRATPDGQAWPLHSHLELAALPGAVPGARHHTRRVLAGWDLGALGEPAELVVSELVTNAIRACQAAGAHGRVQLRLASDRARVLIEVQDDSPQPPVPSGATADDEGRRGLCLVEAVSAAWDWYPDQASSGKVVWALVPAAADGPSPARAAVRYPRPGECPGRATHRSRRCCAGRRLGRTRRGVGRHPVRPPARPVPVNSSKTADPGDHLQQAEQSFIYRPGVMPNAALNVRVKWAWSAKPASSAVSASGRASRSQPRATSRRRITEYRYGLVPYTA